jgi:hypothetical protein
MTKLNKKKLKTKEEKNACMYFLQFGDNQPLGVGFFRKYCHFAIINSRSLFRSPMNNLRKLFVCT